MFCSNFLKQHLSDSLFFIQCTSDMSNSTVFIESISSFMIPIFTFKSSSSIQYTIPRTNEIVSIPEIFQPPVNYRPFYLNHIFLPINGTSMIDKVMSRNVHDERIHNYLRNHTLDIVIYSVANRSTALNYTDAPTTMVSIFQPRFSLDDSDLLAVPPIISQALLLVYPKIDNEDDSSYILRLMAHLLTVTTETFPIVFSNFIPSSSSSTFWDSYSDVYHQFSSMYNLYIALCDGAHLAMSLQFSIHYLLAQSITSPSIVTLHDFPYLMRAPISNLRCLDSM